MVTEATRAAMRPREDNRHWVRLLRAVGSSFDLRKAILAAIGLLLLHAGWDLFEVALPGTRGISPSLPGRTGAAVAAINDREANPDWDQVRSAGWRLTEPVRILASPLISLFEPGRGVWSTLRDLLAVAWVIAVWGLVGGAIARMTVVAGSSLSGSGIVGSTRFALRHAYPLIITPLCPLLAIGFCALICAAVGLVYWLPDPVGTIVGGVLLFVPLGLGLVMILLLLGLVAGWPLVHASIATDTQDVLDALSRSFSYINQRLGKFALAVALLWVVGIPALIAVNLLASGVIHLAVWGLSLAAPASTIAQLSESIPLGRAFASAATVFPALWRGAIGLLAQGWVYGYFWTAATHVYLLLRQDVDGTRWAEVCSASQGEDAEAGLGGMASRA